ncbi:MAG: universal stress protein [Deltaproteobacteria bacterium]|nr:MAG: universal stress protein [Deltaproteobacteria bacterium]
MKILTYKHENTAFEKVLRIGAELSQSLDSEICFLTARSGTPATEEPPPVGVDIPWEQRGELQPGIQILTQAMEVLIKTGFLSEQKSIIIRAVRNGYLFLGSTPAGRRVPFYERYGHLLEVLNYEVDEHQQDLVVVGVPRRGGLGRFVGGDKARSLVLGLHTSVFLVREGDLNSRFLVCADGSPSSLRLFPLLKQFLAAVRGPVDVIWVRKPDATEEETKVGSECAQRARDWLDQCGKGGDLLLPEGDRPHELILEAAGNDSVVVMGASLRHDVHHRVRGSLPLQVLAKTESSMLLAKFPPEVDTDFFEELDTC